jgi:hypothetical protein
VTNATGNGQPTAGWYGNPQDPARERWWDGNGWTEHYRAKPPTTQATSAQGVTPRTSLACPSCCSEDVKTLQIIHAQGTSTGHGISTGWVQGAGAQPGNFAQFNTTTRTVTEAARKAAPPRKRWNGIVLLVIGAAVAIVAGSLGSTLFAGTEGIFTSGVFIVVVIGVLLVIGGFILAIFDAGYNRSVFPAAIAKWDRSWQCQRCGTVSIL